MTRFILFFLLLFSVNTYAQNCKYSENTTVPGYAKMKKRTSERLVLHRDGISGSTIWLSQVDTTYTLRLSFNTDGLHELESAKGDKLVFKLASGKEIVLTANDGYGGSKSLQPHEMTTITLYYKINKAQLMALSKEAAVSFSFAMAVNTQSKDITKPIMEALQSMIKCMLL